MILLVSGIYTLKLYFETYLTELKIVLFGCIEVG